MQGVSNRTIGFYNLKLLRFADWCETQEIILVSEITPAELRKFFLHLEDNGNNPGGRHAYFRAVRTFLNWYEKEAEPDNWKNPIKKGKAPKVPVEPNEPVKLVDFDKLIQQANNSKWPVCDKAILLVLLDTGIRASEFLACQLQDLNLVNGSNLIRKGKGGKPRTVFIGKKTRRVLRAYLKTRNDRTPELWVTLTGNPLGRSGLRQVIRRLCDRAGIPEHGAHDFRRAFVLNMLRNGCDIFTLARLMGHSSIQVLQRYLAQTTEDTEKAHHYYGVVDSM